MKPSKQSGNYRHVPTLLAAVTAGMLMSTEILAFWSPYGWGGYPGSSLQGQIESFDQVILRQDTGNELLIHQQVHPQDQLVFSSPSGPLPDAGKPGWSSHRMDSGDSPSIRDRDQYVGMAAIPESPGFNVGDYGALIRDPRFF